MYAPRVFVSMICTLTVFAVAAYVMTGSFLTAFLETILCAVILQVGYFIGIVYLVRREQQEKDAVHSADAVSGKSRPEVQPARDNITADAAARLHIHDR
ncbi:exopolysaccharide production repressor protein [Neorhizobium sp. NCHU2750]|uniref:exopolysaccharide production repressor protein n=1 Tax=Neorhizobium sp. NCHU2750 TaxID=1825976 RepID=UPI000E70B467|nr:exopolysaccharide production repressor [Neorhizobium sp. NCHU2750]